MRRTKAAWVKQNEDPEMWTMLTYLLFIRNEQVIAQVLQHADRDSMLHNINRGVYSFGADAIVVSFETYVANQELNPLSGEPWGQGEMQYIAQYEQGVEKGIVSDALMTHAQNREGRSVEISSPFKVTKDRDVEWGEKQVFDSDESKVDGLLPDVLNKIMSQPTMHDVASGAREPSEHDMNKLGEERLAVLKMGYQMMAGDPEARDYHMDIAAMRSFVDDQPKNMPAPIAVGLAADKDSRRAQLLDERLKAGEDFGEHGTVFSVGTPT
jgi:hypothetical protein